MSIFNYRAKDAQGIIKEGVVEAVTPVAASGILHRHGLTVLKLEPAAGGTRLPKIFAFLDRVPRKELVIFSRQLSTLMNAKVPIIQALDILSGQVSNKKLRAIVGEMMNDIEGGKSLSESMAGFPNIFSNLYIHLVKSGELSGTLDQALGYIADQQEKDYDLVSKIRGAMTYPLFIVSAIIIVGTLMFIFVLPQMISVLKEAGVDLPLTTKILIFATEGLQKFWAAILVFLVALIGGFQFYIHTQGGRVIWDALRLKMPIFGKLLRNIYMDRLALNLATLVAGGIPIVLALKTVAEVVGNTVYRNIILEAAEEVESGKSIATVFSAHSEIPKIVTQMIKIGEQTGSLDDILTKLSRFYDKEVANTLQTLTTLLEPVIMILLGLAVAVMVAGVILPIYNLASIQ